MEREIGTPPDLIRHEEQAQAFSSTLPELWHLTYMKIAELHRRGITGRGVKIAVNDTGYTPHPLLPVPIAARDFTRSTSGVADRNGHGNHCAGTALGRRDAEGNPLGVSPDAELIVAKVLGDSGSGSTTGINAGRIWAAEQGADIISESLGDGGGPPIREDIAAFERAYEAGANVCVAALGNAGRAGVGRPGSYRETIGVAAINQRGQRADFSSVGDPADIAAPGVQIISAGIRQNLATMSGTSMATPFIAGAFALVIQYRREIGLPDLVGWQAWRSFIADPRFVADAGAPGRDPEFGFGIPQLNKIFDWMLDPEGV